MSENVGKSQTTFLYLHGFFVVDPFEALPSLPNAKLERVLVAISIFSRPMLLPSRPPAFIFAIIRPHVYTIAVLFIVGELALVHFSVRIELNPEARHFVFFKLPVVLTSIFHQLFPLPVHPVVVPRAYILALFKFEFSLAFLPPHTELTDIFRRAALFSPLPILQVVLPLPRITHTISSLVLSRAISFVVVPLPCVDTSIWVVERTFSERLIIGPVSFIFGPIRPGHGSTAVANAT